MNFNTHSGRVGIRNISDYSPFGVLLKERTVESDFFRLGFNGKEMDKELSNGNQYDYGFRIYNANLSKFLSVDPLAKSYPWYTPYQFAGNKPIVAIDIDGLEEYDVNRYFQSDGNGGYRVRLTMTYILEGEQRPNTAENSYDMHTFVGSAYNETGTSVSDKKDLIITDNSIESKLSEKSYNGDLFVEGSPAKNYTLKESAVDNKNEYMTKKSDNEKWTRVRSQWEDDPKIYYDILDVQFTTKAKIVNYENGQNYSNTYGSGSAEEGVINATVSSLVLINDLKVDVRTTFGSDLTFNDAKAQGEAIKQKMLNSAKEMGLGEEALKQLGDRINVIEPKTTSSSNSRVIFKISVPSEVEGK